MKKILIGLIIAAAGATAAAFAFEPAPAADAEAQGYASGNIGYDGQLSFVRLRYATGFGGFGRRGRDPGWFHDYPTADIHMMKIIHDLTSVAPHVDGSNILGLDDPELMMHPIAYMSEPGFWVPSETETLGLRAQGRPHGQTLRR